MKVIFDTSALNALADDPGRAALIPSLRFAYVIGVTETAVSEVAATSDAHRRADLLHLMERLLKFGMCVKPFQMIIEDQAKAYLADGDGYEWRKVNVRLVEAEREIVLQEIIHVVGDETREGLRRSDKDFRGIFANARPEFQNLFGPGPAARPSLQDVTDTLLGNAGAHLAIGADLFERATGTRLSEVDIADFMGRCPPFMALLVALCFSQYDRCIREDQKESLGKAGRLDMLSAVYLAYCKVFVTNDEGQWKALKAVANITGLDTEVLMYQPFKDNLCGLKVEVP